MSALRRLLLDQTEAKIDRLSDIAFIVTLADMVFMWWTFIESGRVPEGERPTQVPMAMMYLLWGSLIVYVAPKEVDRWQKPRTYRSQRVGQVFIYLWVLTVIAMAIVYKLTGGQYKLPDDLGPTVAGVLVIFSGSTVSRALHASRGDRPPDEPEDEKPVEPTGNQDSTL